MKFGYIVKRLIDILGSILLLLFVLPFFFVISVLIKLADGGKIFFTQKRLGMNGREFNIYKFRTMVPNAEKLGTGKYVSAKDSRITKIGIFLRKYSLDELPQLLNVLKGDMSLVGPRPPLTYHPYTIDKYSNYQLKRFLMRPGITGYAQISGRNLISWDERINYDVEYVRRWNICWDFKILVVTFVSVLCKTGVYK